MRPFQLILDYETLEFFEGLSRNDRRYLHARFIYLREYPHNSANKKEPGDDGRDYFICVRGKFAIKYWIDEAVREVRVLRVHFVRFE
jgi:hypothetical protein